MAILDGDQFLAAMCRDANDYQQTEAIIQAHVAVDPIGLPVDVAVVRQVPLTPGLVFVEPLGLQSRDRVGRQPLPLVTQQSRQSLLVITGEDALEVEPGNQLLDAAGPLQVRRQQGTVEAHLAATTAPHLGHLDGDVTDADLHGALRQIAVAHCSLPTVLQVLLAYWARKVASSASTALAIRSRAPWRSNSCNGLVQRVGDLGFWLR